MRLRCKTIASCGNKHIHRAELINVTFNSDQRQQDMLDGLVRSIYYLYNTVFIINFDENSCNPIVASASSWEFLHQKTYGLEEVRLSYARQNIHPDDQERFLEFVRLDNMEQRIEDSPEGMIADYFRTKGADGNFTWTSTPSSPSRRPMAKYSSTPRNSRPWTTRPSANTSSRNTSKTTNQN